MKRTLTILTSLFCLAVLVPAQSIEPGSAPAEIYLAKDDGEGKAGDAATEFLPSDVPIHCVVKLSSSVPATVKMFLIAVNVSGVKPGSNIVSTSYTTSEGENIVFFHGRPHKQWVPGIYRADIHLNGKKIGSLEFVVKGDVRTAGANTFAPKSSRPLARNGKRPN
ncbi:hypothetical protein [Leptolyngbya sp. 7M]|uniref:hypothetical protein n=1 Tax=Leptolyngbya sp. 7M TaxID=2812896 RepID=UPI001B8C26C2|nr:hypothetical protein [Leptolyngbya sp. 7M]QYO65527.1 hypothetical protein JVX88_01700 [Leptolyngbya sp. 7M]